MQVRNPQVDAQIALQNVGAPYQSPQSGQPASSPLPDYSDHLTLLVRYFEESEDLTRRARELSERDRDYHDNFDDNQWTVAEKAKLAKRGQPAITSNYVKRKVSTLCGGERRMRSDPKAFPRNPQDEQTSNAATDALRFVGDQNKFNVTRSKVYEEMLIEGFGGVDVVIEQTATGEKRVKVKRVPWDRLFFDPHSACSDFSDAKYKGIVIWRDAKKTDQDVLGETLRSVGTDTYDDRPKTSWVDSKRTRVRVVQIHYLYEGEWMVATFTKAGFVEGGDPVVSPYKDRDGKPACSLIMRSAYVDRENNRFGAVRDWISTQEEINKRRSKMLHLLSQRQTFGNKRGVTDVRLFKTEMAKPDGHAEINEAAEWGKDVGLIDTAAMAQGHSEMLHLSINEMQASGPNAAMAGKAPGEQSGRALEAQMQAGSVEMEPLVDELRQWTREVYEACWMRVRQFWTEETWVRVTDDDRNVKFVGLNRQVTVADKLADMQPEARAMWMQQRGIQPNDPRLQQVVARENMVSGLDVDIEIEEGPDLSTLKSEQFGVVSDLAKSGLVMSNGKPVPLEALVELSDLRNKDAWIKKWGGGGAEDPAMQHAQQQMQAMGQQMQQMHDAMQKMQSDTSAKFAELQIRAKDAETKRYDAETKRAAVVAPAMSAPEVQAVVVQMLQQMLGGQVPIPPPQPQQAQPMPAQPLAPQPPQQQPQAVPG